MKADHVDQVEEFVEEDDGVPFYSQKPTLKLDSAMIQRYLPPDRSMMIMSPSQQTASMKSAVISKPVDLLPADDPL